MTLTLVTLQVGDGDPVDVHFNPASLRVTTTNQFDDGAPNQAAKPTAFKLDVELLFDTTETGVDVHRTTRALRYAAIATAQGAVAHDEAGNASEESGGNTSHLQLVILTWGTRSYQGYIESLNETLDYWSSDGVPLRATIQISMKGTTQRFLTGRYSDIQRYADNSSVPSLPKVVMASVAKDNPDAFLKSAQGAGDTSTGRGLAAANGIENMRSTGASAGIQGSAGIGAGAGFSVGAGAGLAMGGGVQLQAAAGFKLSGGISAGASIGFGIGASAGLSAGAGLGASVGVGMAAGLGGGVGIGASAGIGIGASAGMSIGGGIVGSLGGGSSGGGFGLTTSTNVTGLDGQTRTTLSTSRSSSAGLSASSGAFAGLGTSRTTMPGAGFNPDSLLPPPTPPTGSTSSFDVSGRVVSDSGQVAASYSSNSSVTAW